MAPVLRIQVMAGRQRVGELTTVMAKKLVVKGLAEWVERGKSIRFLME